MFRQQHTSADQLIEAIANTHLVGPCWEKHQKEVVTHYDGRTKAVKAVAKMLRVSTLRGKASADVEARANNLWNIEKLFGRIFIGEGAHLTEPGHGARHSAVINQEGQQRKWSAW